MPEAVECRAADLGLLPKQTEFISRFRVGFQAEKQKPTAISAQDSDF